MKFELVILEKTSTQAVANIRLIPENDDDKDILGRLAYAKLLTGFTGSRDDVHEANFYLRAGYGNNAKNPCSCK